MESEDFDNANAKNGNNFDIAKSHWQRKQKEEKGKKRKRYQICLTKGE